MMKFNEHLKQLRKDKGLSQNDLANTFGYKSFTTIQKWEDGTAMPPMRTLQAIADYFDISVDELINGRDVVKIPILGTVRGGPSQLAQEDYLGYELVHSSEVSGGEYFYLQVVGDSMIKARIYPKDLIYVKRQNHVEEGEIAVVLVGDEATVKRIYYGQNSLILHPENEAYEDRRYSQDEIDQLPVQIVGKVIHVKIRL